MVGQRAFTSKSVNSNARAPWLPPSWAACSRLSALTGHTWAVLSAEWDVGRILCRFENQTKDPS